MSKKWIDHDGLEIPSRLITSLDKLKERKSNQLLKRAKKIAKDLQEYKELYEEVSKEILEKSANERGLSLAKHKGNFTWYNFDKSVRHETDMQSRIVFDDLLIHSAEEKILEYLRLGLNGASNPLVREMSLEAFKRRNGQIDPKECIKLLSYKSKIPKKGNELFHDGLEDLQNGMTRVYTKLYHRIAERQPNGEYETIQLNLSAI